MPVNHRWNHDLGSTPERLQTDIVWHCIREPPLRIGKAFARHGSRFGHNRETNMQKIIPALVLAGAVALGGCAYNDPTVESAATGAAVGAATGALGGAVIGGVSPVEGAAAGAVVGGLAGAVTANTGNNGTVTETDGGAYGTGTTGTYGTGPNTYDPGPPPPPSRATTRRRGERG